MNTKTIGYIGVDAGLCWIGDPCYVLPEDSDERPQISNWSDFCKKMGHLPFRQFTYANGNMGLGVCFSTGYGDGMYPVKATFNEEGRIASVSIKFIEEE